MAMDARNVTLWRWLQNPGGKGWWLDFAQTNTIYANEILDSLIKSEFFDYTDRNKLCWTVGKEYPTIDPSGNKIK